jgi:hypothetical protein
MANEWWKNVAFLGNNPFMPYAQKALDYQPTETQDARVENPTMGSHLLHPGATKRQIEKNAAMQALVDENPDQLGTIDLSGKVNKMSAFPDISHINWSGILQGGKNIFGLGENQNASNYLDSRSPITYPGQSPEGSYDMSRRHRLGDTSGLTRNYGMFGERGEKYDPAFGDLGQVDYWDTAYPGSFKKKGYYDEYGEIPRLQRNNFYENFKDQGITGLDVQENINTTEQPVRLIFPSDPVRRQELGTEHSDIAADKKRSLPTFGLSGILKGLKNQFKINPEKQKEFDSWEENKNQKGWGYIGDTGLRGNIYEGSGGKKFNLVDPTTGFNVLQNKNWRGGTGNSLREQINLKNAWIADRLLRGKGLSGKARAYAKLNKLGTYADQETFTPPPGGGPLNEPGGEWVGGAPAYTHQGIGGGEYTNEIGNVEYQDPYDPGGGEAAGGLMRIHSRGRYSKGGRVGILAAF